MAVSPPVTNPPAVTSAPVVIAIVSNIPVRVNPPIVPTAATVSNPAPPATKVIPRYAYRNLVRPAPGNRAESEGAFTQGLQAQRQKRLPDALAAFRDAVKADPAYFQARYNLAWTAYALKDWPTALEAYETALAIEPESTDARYNFALTLRQANYPLDAANELERVLARRPDDAGAHLSLANLYAQQLGGANMARPHYLKVLELQPTHPQATQIRYWLSENAL
jgi:tetratricopeptide (TPR) repeat protein